MRVLAKKQFTGQVLLEYLFLYAALRFAIEFFRNDDRGFVLYGLLSTSQLLAVIAVLCSAAVYLYLIRRPGKIKQN
jgi:phosphatidylglycerol:prolipoprotein diacylglycerol transferase